MQWLLISGRKDYNSRLARQAMAVLDSLSLGPFNILVFALILVVMLALFLFSKITKPVRALLSLLSIALFLYFLLSSGLAKLGLSGVLGLAEATTSLFRGLLNLLVGRAMRLG